MKNLTKIICLIIFTTSFAQEGWYTQKSYNQFTINNCFFISENVGWIIGSYNIVAYGKAKILKTNNGGDDWIEVQDSTIIPANCKLTSAFFINENIGWVAGFYIEWSDYYSSYVKYQIALKTTDGGNNWSRQIVDSLGEIESIFFINDKIGFIVGNINNIDPLFLRTIDGGITWQQIPVDNTYGLTSIYFPDSKTGWAVGGNGMILKTINSGETWINQKIQTSNWFTSVHCVDTTHIWAISPFLGYPIYSGDGGNNWQILTKLGDGIGTVYVLANDNILLSGRGYIYQNRNNGQDLIPRYKSDTYSDSYKMFFVNRNVGWAISSNEILKTTTGGVILDSTNWKIYSTLNSGLPYDNITAIAIDGDGNKWIGTYGGGLSKFDGTNWSVFNTSNSGLPDNSITCINIDANGNKWIGTYKGLVKFDGTNWSIYDTSNSGLSSVNVRSIAIEGNGIIWIGMEPYGLTLVGGGLAKFDGANWGVYNISNSGLPDENIKSIAIDGNGNKWIGTYNGLVKFDGTNWSVYNTSNSGIPDNNVSSIAIDADGSKWMYTYHGLTKFDGTNFSVYNLRNVETITIDVDNCKWIASYGGGLTKFDGTNWSIYNTMNSGLPSNNVYSLAVDVNENKWIGTEDGGLAVFKENGILSVKGNGNKKAEITNNFLLNQNYPNPFNPVTKIEFQISISTFVSLKVYNSIGKEVAKLVNEIRPAGNYSIEFNGSNLSSGVYFYRMRAGNFSETKKLILMK